MQLEFFYKNASGEVSQRRLIKWSEVGVYLQGFDADVMHPCTFRKDRVLRYLNGCDALLKQPFVEGPPTAPKPKRAPAKEKTTGPETLFTGFKAAERAALEAQATEAGLSVVKSVTAGLVFLVIGKTAGPAKVEKSRAQGVYIVSESEFDSLIETGELPDHAVNPSTP